MDEIELPPLVVTSFANLNILVVDDHPPTLDLIEAMLQSTAVGDVQKALDISTALNILSDTAQKIDCVICDHRVQPITGLELLKKIRAGSGAVVARDMRFILVTGDAHEKLVRAAAQLDVSGFLTKPMSTGQLTKAMHLAFGRPMDLKAPTDYAKVLLPT